MNHNLIWVEWNPISVISLEFRHIHSPFYDWSNKKLKRNWICLKWKVGKVEVKMILRKKLWNHSKRFGFHWHAQNYWDWVREESTTEHFPAGDLQWGSLIIVYCILVKSRIPQRTSSDFSLSVLSKNGWGIIMFARFCRHHYEWQKMVSRCLFWFSVERRVGHNQVVWRSNRSFPSRGTWPKSMRSVELASRVQRGLLEELLRLIIRLVNGHNAN